MNSKISVVIITKNAERTLAKCLESIRNLSDDLVVVDAHSTDTTRAVAQFFGTRVLIKSWTSYGDARNYGAEMAQYDWIFSIDSDEVIDEDLIRSITTTELSDSVVYAFKRRNYLSDRAVRYGELSPSYKTRLYNKTVGQWNNRPVHEQLVFSKRVKKIKLAGLIHHYAYRNIHEMKRKYRHYADLAHRPDIIKRYISPLFHFVYSYLLRLGFLEGDIGYTTALIRAQYVYRKYKNS